MNLRSRRNVSFLIQLALVLLAALHVAITVSYYLSNQFYTQDIGHIDYLFYNTYHGRFFWSIVCGCPHFAKHFTPTLVLLVPFHALFRHVLFLTILEDLAVLSGAWAVAWMVDGFVRGRRAVMAGASQTDLRGLSPLGLAAGWLYAANPHVGSILLSHHFESFAMALSLWALAALVNRRRLLFWVLMILALGVKEDMALYWGTFGAWWMLFGWTRDGLAPTRPARGSSHVIPSRRNSGSSSPTWQKRLRFGGALVVFCLLWAVLAVSVIRAVAHASGQPPFEYSPRYEWMGKTPGQRVATLAARPREVLIPLINAAILFLPWVLGLPLLSPATLLLLIPPIYVMGMSRTTSQYYLYYYYSYPFIAFLFLAVARGLARLARWTHRSRRLRRPLLNGIVVVLFLAGCLMLPLPTRTERRHRWIAHPTARQTWIRMALRDLIPPRASVVAQFDLFCQIPYRHDIYPLSEADLDRAEYWVFDTKGYLGDIGTIRFWAMLDRADRLVAEGKADVVIKRYGLYIVRRREK